MAKQIINVGTALNAGDGEALRDALIKTNGNFSELYTTLSGLSKGDIGLGNVTNTSDANKPISTATQTALDAKAGTGAIGNSGLTMTGGYLVGRTTNGVGAAQELAPAAIKTLLSLDLVSNTSDANKPVSTAQATAIALKADVSHTHVAADIQLSANTFLGRNVTGTGNASALTVTQTKNLLLLNNVDNTADADKPISTLTATALTGKAAVSHTHTISQVTDLQTTLDAKSPIGHNHDITTLTGYAASQALKADVVHTHVIADVTGLAEHLVHSVKAFVPSIQTNTRYASVADTAFSIVIANSVATAGVAATAQTVFQIKKNDANVGTVTFAAGSAVGVIAISSAGNRALVVGDVIEFTAPATLDDTLARVAFVLRN